MKAYQLITTYTDYETHKSTTNVYRDIFLRIDDARMSLEQAVAVFKEDEKGSHYKGEPCRIITDKKYTINGLDNCYIEKSWGCGMLFEIIEVNIIS